MSSLCCALAPGQSNGAVSKAERCTIAISLETFIDRHQRARLRSVECCDPVGHSRYLLLPMFPYAVLCQDQIPQLHIGYRRLAAPWRAVRGAQTFGKAWSAHCIHSPVSLTPTAVVSTWCPKSVVKAEITAGRSNSPK